MEKKYPLSLNNCIKADELELYLNKLLQIDRYQDYCPNGRQIEGCDQVYKLAVGVTASLSLIEAAIEWGANAILVHHGFFWKNEDPLIKGVKYRRIRALINHQINLFAYHIPLDVHEIYGNNKQLGNILGFENSYAAFGGQSKLGWLGVLSGGLSLTVLKKRVTRCLGRKPIVLGKREEDIKKVAWCTGAAQNFFEEAINYGAEAYLTGEVSETSFHLAMETGIPFFSCGHHATERYGVQALGNHLRKEFGIDVCFIDSPNPI